MDFMYEKGDYNFCTWWLKFFKALKIQNSILGIVIIRDTIRDVTNFSLKTAFRDWDTETLLYSEIVYYLYSYVLNWKYRGLTDECKCIGN